MNPYVDLSQWIAEGNSSAHRSGNGWIVQLTTRYGGKAAKICFPLPVSTQGQKIKAVIKLRLLDPWSELVAFGIADADGETKTHCRLKVDGMLHTVMIERTCGNTPLLFLSSVGSYGRLSFYLEDVKIEEARSLLPISPPVRVQPASAEGSTPLVAKTSVASARDGSSQETSRITA